MRYSMVALAVLGLAICAGPAQAAAPTGAAKPGQAAKPAAPPIKQETVRFVNANLETLIVRVKDMKGRILTFKATKKTALVRNLRPVRGEDFNPKPGEMLVIRYWPMKPGENILQSIMDVQTATSLAELTGGTLGGKLLKADFSRRTISVQVQGAGPKAWTLAPNAIILANWKPAKIAGDPTIKPPPKGELPNIIKLGDEVRVVLTKDNKVRGVMDAGTFVWLTMAKTYLDQKTGEGPPQP